MNEYDSTLVARLLQGAGYSPADSRESCDVLLLNSCSVRQHAEERLFSLIAQYRKLKAARPGLKLALLGCTARKYQKGLLERFPYLDLVVGPDGYRKLPELLAREESESVWWMGDDSLEEYRDILPLESGVSAYIAISRGCDNFCSYCVVPYVRGRERSRPPDNILQEMRYLVERGIKEITFLGQNVNSYRFGEVNFASLLRSANEVEGIERLRFLTSHPKDLSLDLIRAMAECSKVAPHLHFPLQSGSDRILGAMNRKYNRAHYLNLVELARKHIPAISLTTDIIVGFPSETEADFEQTLDLVKTVEFDDAFTYRYSVRSGTKAEEMPDDVPESVKIDRLQKLIAQVRAISSRNLKALKGRQCHVLVERPSKKDEFYWMGRTEHNYIAILPANGHLVGDMVKVAVEGISGFTLRCQLIS
jgi:tRNA-2-methylthio-N6-dimethylallyladenosine synthase